MSLFGPNGIFLYFASVTSFMSVAYGSSFFLGLCPQHSLRGDHGSRNSRGNLLSLPNQRELSKTTHYPENMIKKEKTCFQHKYLGCVIFVIKHRPTQSILWLKDNQVCLHQNIYKLIKNNCMPKTVTL